MQQIAREAHCSGNAPGLRHADTLCHVCGRLLLAQGYRLVARTRDLGRCPGCRAALAGVGLEAAG